jgi:hypothetical protein
MALVPDARAKLLGKIRAGHDLESACAVLNLQPQELCKDVKLMAEVNAAFKTGTSKLRARLLDGALKNNDLRVLSTLLEEREREQTRIAAEQPKGEPDIDKILEDVAKLYETVLRNDPLKVLPPLLEVALSSGRLNAETVATALALRELLANHEPLKYSPEWWKAERAAGRNGMYQVAPPALAAPAAPAEPS